LKFLGGTLKTIFAAPEFVGLWETYFLVETFPNFLPTLFFGAALGILNLKGCKGRDFNPFCGAGLGKNLLRKFSLKNLKIDPIERTPVFCPPFYFETKVF